MKVQLRVVQGRGTPWTIEFDAPSREDACLRARQQGYEVLSVGSASSWLNRRQASKLDYAVFAEQLGELLRAGLGVSEAIAALHASAGPEQEPTLRAFASAMRSGMPFSATLGAQGEAPEMLVALVRASEITSDLAQALDRFLDHHRRASELRHRIVSAITYPLLVLCVGSLVLLFLAGYVMPRFAAIFDGMTGELPWTARAMVAWAHWLDGHETLAALSAALFLCAVVASLGSKVVRGRLNSILLHASPVRRRMRTYFLARWLRACGVLVEGGIPFADAMPLAARLLPSWLQTGGRSAERAVRDGLRPSAAFAHAGMTTPVTTQLLNAAEGNGDLGAVLQRIAAFHESEIARDLERAMRGLEPAVMLLIGIAVGTIVVLMYMPIFELASAIQ